MANRYRLYKIHIYDFEVKLKLNYIIVLIYLWIQKSSPRVKRKINCSFVLHDCAE